MPVKYYISTKQLRAGALLDQFGLWGHSEAGDKIIFTKTCSCFHTILGGKIKCCLCDSTGSAGMLTD